MHQAVHSQGVRADQPPGGSCPSFGFPLLCPFMSLVPSLKWVSGACTLPGSGWWCPRPIREGGMFPTRGSHSPPWLPLFCGLFFLVTTSSDHHLGPCFPSLTTGQGIGCTPKIYPLEECILEVCPQSPGKNPHYWSPWILWSLYFIGLPWSQGAHPSFMEQGWGLDTPFCPSDVLGMRP